MILVIWDDVVERARKHVVFKDKREAMVKLEELKTSSNVRTIDVFLGENIRQAERVRGPSKRPTIQWQ